MYLSMPLYFLIAFKALKYRNSELDLLSEGGVGVVLRVLWFLKRVYYYLIIVPLVIGQFSGPVILGSTIFYWHLDTILGVVVIATMVLIFVSVWVAFVFGLCRLVDFSFSKLLDCPYYAYLWLQRFFLALYIIFLTATFCSKRFVDLTHFDVFGKLVGFLPAVHCYSPEDCHSFLLLLAELVKVEKRVIFGAETFSVNNAALINAAIQPVLHRAVDSLAFSNTLSDSTKEALRVIIADHLARLTQEILDCSSEVRSYIDKNAGLLGSEALQKQHIKLFGRLCLKSYLEFFFGSPRLFPSILPEFCNSADFDSIYRMDYLQITNQRLQDLGYAPLIDSHIIKSHLDITINCHMSMTVAADAINSVLSEANENVSVAVLPSILLTNNYNFTEVSSPQLGLQFVSELDPARVIGRDGSSGMQVAFKFNVLDYTFCRGEKNTYTPKLLVVCPGSDVDSVILFREGAQRLLAGTPEYAQCLKVCLDNLSDAADATSYSTRFLGWYSSDGLTDQEYADSLQTAEDSSSSLSKIFLF